MKNGKKVRGKNRIRVHRGLDLRGVKGTPVYALADGEVVLAEELFYEGNFVLVDHGNRIFSYYMHLDSLDVKKGDRVKAGQLLARVGSTGVSTASHLHVSFIIRGIQVDPLSILPLPFRD
jgi:murein DD-endopeptidase MepM/ murein hydrolase activator NlpD